MCTCMSIFFAILVQLLRHVWFFATPNWTASHQDSLSFTISQSLIKFTSIELVMLSNRLILCHPLSSCPQSFPTSGSFPVSQVFQLGGQSIGASASASVLPTTIQYWFPQLTALISLQSRRVQRHDLKASVLWHLNFFMVQLSLTHTHAVWNK